MSTIKSPSRKRTTIKKPEASRQIDITAAIEAPLKIRQDGKTQNVSSFEAILRQHVRKALVGRAIASMKFVLGQAEKYKLIKPPPPPLVRGGVFIVPKNLPEEIERQIFDYHEDDSNSMSRIANILLRFYHAQKR